MMPLSTNKANVFLCLSSCLDLILICLFNTLLFFSSTISAVKISYERMIAMISLNPEKKNSHSILLSHKFHLSNYRYSSVMHGK